jgi:tRNA pseudouridine38-40 synthase
VFRHVLGHEEFNILAAGRTDAGVSCHRGAFELFSKFPQDPIQVLKDVNENLPDDIRLLEALVAPKDFNIIQDVDEKEYKYYFSTGEKFHPFLAGNCSFFQGDFDVQRMKEAAALFEGSHDFRRFCAKDRGEIDYERHILLSQLEEHQGQLLAASSNSTFFCYRVKGKGFLMHQVRLMVGAILEMGKGTIQKEDILEALKGNGSGFLSPKPAANGLVLENIIFKTSKN